MPGPLGFQKPKNSTPIYSPSGGRGGHQVIGYSMSSPYGAATYDNQGNPTNTAAKKVVLDYKKAHPSGGGGLFGSISSGVTQFFEDPAKATTQALQPVEKTVNYIGAHPEMQLALAMAVAAPYASTQIAAYLTTAGLSGAAATAAASAITSITVQVAQGVPIEKATENALVNVAVSGVSNEAAQQINKVISSPGVTNAITSTVASGLSTAAKGGSQADVEKAMTAGLAGSTASTIYKEAVDSSSNVISKAVGGAAAGGVTGGTEGAVTGGLSAAAGALGSDLAKPTPKPSDTASLPTDQVAALQGAQVLDESGQPVGGEDIPAANPMSQDPAQQAAAASAAGSEKGAFLPSTTDQQVMDLIAESPDQSEAETARLARKEAELAAAEVTTPAETTKTTEGSKYTPSLFISTYKSPATRTSTSALGNALGTTGSTTGLTASRGAGEIEGTGTGGKRKKVWNEESLKLKDALGV